MNNVEFMKWQQFAKTMKDKSEEVVQDFGFPDRTIGFEDAKLWRFRAVCGMLIRPAIVLEDAIPVYSGTKQVGTADAWHSEDWMLYADVVADYQIPERMDVDNDKEVFLVPGLSVTRERLPGMDYEVEVTQVVGFYLSDSPKMMGADPISKVTL